MGGISISKVKCQIATSAIGLEMVGKGIVGKRGCKYNLCTVQEKWRNICASTSARELKVLNWRIIKGCVDGKMKKT
jgi:hypothetical protein